MYQARFIDLGRNGYRETWDYQQQLQTSIIEAKVAGHNTGDLASLIFVEHPHVYTLGKSGKENNLLINPQFLEKIEATFYKTDRGGDITYHGPGQLVGYPLFDLESLHMGVKNYIYNIEEAIIKTLAAYSIPTTRLTEATGVWIVPEPPVPPRKICAIGVKVSRGITMHGFALNVNTRLEYFSYINPCGFTDKGVTSMEKEMGTTLDMDAVKALLKENIARQFNLRFS